MTVDQGATWHDPQGVNLFDRIGRRHVSFATASNASVHLELVIPAFNEEKRLPSTVASAASYLGSQRYGAAITVVDNGSVDRTSDLAFRDDAADVHVQLIGCARQGKGAAIRRGILSSNAHFVGFCDADGATPIETLDRVLPLLEGGHPIVIGSRHAAGAEILTPQSLFRRAGGSVFRTLTHAVVGSVRDTQCGFKFFRRDVACRLFTNCRTDGFAFDVELLASAERLGYPIVELPVTWSDVSGSTFRAVPDGIQSMIDVVRMWQSLSRREAGGEIAWEPSLV